MAECLFSACTNELPPQTRGRPRKYCSASCRVQACRARSLAAPQPTELAADELEQLLRRRTRRGTWLSSPSRSRGRSSTWWR